MKYNNRTLRSLFAFFQGALVAALIFLPATFVYAEVKEFTLTVTENKIELNGNTFNVWAYDGKVPGPEIRVREGDTVKIKLVNKSGAKHGLFFHGIHVGARVSEQEQEIVVDPGYEYTYGEFIAKPAGTHLYHCGYNMAEHLSMGLYGAIIVEGKDDIKYDKDLVYILSDWSSKAAKGEGHHEAGHPMTLMDNDITTINDRVVNGDNPISIDAKNGEKIRLRLANIGHLPQTLRYPNGFIITHEDGYPVPKLETQNELTIHPGKRFDLSISAEGSEKSVFYHSITMPEGAMQRWMRLQSEKQPSSSHKEAMHGKEHNNIADGSMIHSKEAPIIVLSVSGGVK